MSSTAAQLIAYRTELLAGGIPEDLVADLVRDAAHTDVKDRGLRIAHHQAAADTPEGSGEAAPQDEGSAPRPQG